MRAATVQSLWVLLIFIASPMRSALGKELADHYDKNSEMQTSLAQEFINNDLDLRGDEAILDIGCGNGKLTYELSQRLTTGSIIGIDKTPHMIHYARDHYSDARATYKVLDVDNIGSLDTKFDLIVSFSAFVWFDDPKEAIYQMSRLLTENGKICILSYPKESQDWAYYRNAILSKLKWKSHCNEEFFNNILSSKDIKDVAKELGLKILENEVIDNYSTYSSSDDFRDNIRGYLEWFFPSLPEEEWDEYTQRVIEIGGDQFFYNPEGKFVVPYKYIKVILQK